MTLWFSDDQSFLVGDPGLSVRGSQNPFILYGYFLFLFFLFFVRWPRNGLLQKISNLCLKSLKILRISRRGPRFDKVCKFGNVFFT